MYKILDTLCRKIVGARACPAPNNCSTSPISNRGNTVNFFKNLRCISLYFLNSIFENNIGSDGGVYSVDKVCIKGVFSYGLFESTAKYIDSLDKFALIYPGPELPFDQYFLFNVTHKENINIHYYRHNCFFHFKNTNPSFPDLSFYFGCCLNDTGSIKPDYWKIEFNPNKVGSFKVLLDFLKYIIDGSKQGSVTLDFFDVAIDYPVCRSDFCLIRSGRRSYWQLRKSKVDWTEYLGMKSSQRNGYVKLYNKRLESGLDTDLTRLEISLTELSFDNFKKYFPNLRIIPEQFSERQKNSKDFLFCYAILQNGDLIQLISNRVQKAKILKILDEFQPALEPDEAAFKNCIEYIKGLFKL